MRIAGLVMVAAMLSVMATACPALARGGEAGDFPCYEISAVIQAPPCIIPASTIGTSISPNGEYVVGFFYCAGGNDRGWAYRTSTEQFTVLPMPPGVSIMYAWDVNDTGLAVGHMGGVAGAFGFVFDLNTSQFVAQIQALAIGGNGAEFIAITAQGVACGTRTISLNPTRDNAFTWSAKDGVQDLGLIHGQSTTARDMNDSLWLTGTFIEVGITTGFLWRGDDFISLGTLAGLESTPLALNDRNEVVGRSRVPLEGFPFGVSHAFVWAEGKLLDLGTLLGDNVSAATEISHNGIVSGVSSHIDLGNNRAFLRNDGRLQLLADLVVDGLADGISGYLEVGGTSLAGNMVVNVRRNGTVSVVVLSPVQALTSDVDVNCRVNMDDLLTVISEWGQTDSSADADNDGIVGIGDLMLVIENWTVW